MVQAEQFCRAIGLGVEGRQRLRPQRSQHAQLVDVVLECLAQGVQRLCARVRQGPSQRAPTGPIAGPKSGHQGVEGVVVQRKSGQRQAGLQQCLAGGRHAARVGRGSAGRRQGFAQQV